MKSNASMLLLTYFQKQHSITRREFTEMLQDEAIFVNKEIIQGHDTSISIGDNIQLKLPNGETYTETVKYFPGFAPKLVLFHKPKGYVCSKDDPHNKTIYELLPDSWLKDFWYIGRLDKDSTGLLLLTNDSTLVDQYENPFHNVYKVYEVEINKPLRGNDVKKMRKGVRVSADGELEEDENGLSNDLLKCVSVTQKRIQDKYFVIITLNEGKNRHIRRLMRALGYNVRKLHRLKVGKRHIGTLKPGARKMEKIRKPKGRSEKVKARKEEKKRAKKKKKKKK